MKKWKKKLQHHFHEVMRTKTSPHSIALGFAIGTFISVLPTPGFNILLGLLVVLIYERVNKFSLFGSMAIWNPLILTPIYILSKQIGTLLIGPLPVVEYEITILNQVYEYTRRFLLGNIILATTFAISSYFIVRRVAKSYKST